MNYGGQYKSKFTAINKKYIPQTFFKIVTCNKTYAVKSVFWLHDVVMAEMFTIPIKQFQ